MLVEASAMAANHNASGVQAQAVRARRRLCVRRAQERLGAESVTKEHPTRFIDKKKHDTGDTEQTRLC
jgi:hypothetical protein